MEPFLGQIQARAFSFAPRGWAKCEGQTLPIADNQALFSLLGTTYGGDGRTTFALPDLRKASKRDAINYCIAVQGIYPARAKMANCGPPTSEGILIPLPGRQRRPL